MAPSSDNLRRVLYLITGIVVVLGLGAMVLWDEGPFAFTYDDAYYYFGIAENLAGGDGSTFDRINDTNGYHPLWLLVCVPAYLIGLDGMTAVRVLMVVQVLAYGAALLLTAREVSRAVAGWPRLDEERHRRAGNVTVAVTFALVFANPFVARVFVNGMESGLLVLLYAALFVMVVRRPDPESWIRKASRPWQVGVAALLVLLFLARTDTIVMSGLLGIWLLAKAWPIDRERVEGILIVFGPVVVTTVAYLAYNQVAFGTAIQISGLVKRQPLTVDRAALAFLVLALAAVLFVVSLRARRARASRFPRSLEFFADTGWFAAFCVSIVGYYHVLQTQQWLWYYAPAAIYGAWMLLLWVADISESACIESVERGTSFARAVLPVELLVLTPLGVALVILTVNFLDPNLRSIQVANHDAGVWIDENLPEDAVLASWDAGVVGYFSDRRVINLDGVVNSLEWHRAETITEQGRFLADRELGFVVNHGTAVDGQDPDILAFVRDRFGPGTADRMTLVRDWPFEFSGRTVDGGGGRTGENMAVFLYELPT